MGHRNFLSRHQKLLHIKSFIGTSKNAVMIQIWTALITILVLKHLKIIAKYNWYLSNLVAFLRINLFLKMPNLKRSQPELLIGGVFMAVSFLVS